MIDEVDMKIVNKLKEDCRKSYRTLGVEMGLAPGTISTRVNKMVEKGIIKNFSAVINYEKIGYELTSIIEIVVSKGKLIETEQEIAKFPEVCAVYDSTGTTDIIIIAKVKNRSELSHLIKTLLAMRYIERTNTHVVLTTVKEDFINHPSTRY
ncbi:MAG: Lrp/AsnC family transcriptional regulator [Candidatus Hodarchaeales archaeon]